MLKFSEIDDRRAKLGIDQKTLAERAGLKPQSYSKLRGGSPRGATEATLTKLTNALNALEQERALS